MAEHAFRPASTNIVEVQFDDSTDTLSVEFQSGQTYDYFNVPPSVYRQFQGAPSAGSFFHRQIKGRYGYEER